MTDFSSFFPSGGGGGGGVIINNFQTGSAAIEFDQLQAYSIVSNGTSSQQTGSAQYGPGNIQSEIPLGSYNTFATVADVTNSNGGAFCYATLNDSNHGDFSGTSSRTTLGGNTIFKITLDGVVHLVHYRPTLGGVNTSGRSFLGFPAVIRGSIQTGAFRASEYKYLDNGSLNYGTFWDASLLDVSLSSQNTYIAGIGTSGTVDITVPLGANSLILDSNGKALFSRSGGIRLDVSPAGGQFGADGNPNTTGFSIAPDQTVAASASNVGYVISADGLTLQYHTTFSQNDGQGTLTITGTTIDTSANTATISFSRTSPSTNGRARIGNIQFQGQLAFGQQTVRSTRISNYSASGDSVSSNFLDPALHVTMGYPWVKFDSTCKVEMSHESQGNGSGTSRPPSRQTNVGIYKF